MPSTKKVIVPITYLKTLTYTHHGQIKYLLVKYCRRKNWVLFKKIDDCYLLAETPAEIFVEIWRRKRAETNVLNPLFGRMFVYIRRSNLARYLTGVQKSIDHILAYIRTTVRNNVQTNIFFVGFFLQHFLYFRLLLIIYYDFGSRYFVSMMWVVNGVNRGLEMCYGYYIVNFHIFLAIPNDTLIFQCIP